MAALRHRTRWQIGLRYSALPPTVRAVAWALSTWMDPDGGGCRPGVETIAEAVGIGRATTFRALGELERAGWVTRSGGGGRARPSIYVPSIPGGASLLLDERLGKGLTDATVSAENGRTAETVSGPKPSHERDETVAPVRLNGRTGATRVLPETTKRRLDGVEAVPAAVAAEAEEAVPPPWVVEGLPFWEYARRLRESKTPVEATT